MSLIQALFNKLKPGDQPAQGPDANRRDSERRSGLDPTGAPRYSVELVTDSGRLHVGSVVDVSIDGICVILSEPVKKKELLSLMSGKPGESPDKTRCQVMWIKKEKTGTHSAGLKVVG